MSFLISPISAVTTGPPWRPALNSGTIPYRARSRSFREVVKEVVLEIIEAQRAQRLCNRGGVVKIQEHEDTLFGDGPMITTQQEIHQRPGAEHPIELSDKVEEEAYERKNRQCRHEAAAQYEVSVLLRPVVRQKAPVLG